MKAWTLSKAGFYTSKDSKSEAARVTIVYAPANPLRNSPEEFKGKRVIVVGLCASGSEAAVDLSGVAEQVWLSHRSGTRIVSQLSDGGASG